MFQCTGRGCVDSVWARVVCGMCGEGRAVSVLQYGVLFETEDVFDVRGWEGVVEGVLRFLTISFRETGMCSSRTINTHFYTLLDTHATRYL